MKVIRPTPITDASLVSSSIAENDFPAYAAGTSYAAGDRVIRTTTHRIYRSLVAANSGHTPETSPTQWQDIGPTNRWAMFDQSVGTLTGGTGSIAVTIAPGSIDTLAVLDLTAVSVRVSMSVGGTTVYDKTKATAAGGEVIDNWFAYFFEPVGVRTTLVFDDLATFPTGQVTVTVNGDTGAAQALCGTLLVGRRLDLGSTEAGAGTGITDFSKKTTDDFGVTTVVPRAWSKRATLRTLTQTAFVDAIERELAKLRATPTVWYEDEFDVLTIYGFYKSFDLDIAFANISYCSLTLEGLSTAN